MGGCKCSYRTCSKASDGKTHFYHFPVRDEKRCEQWIINSNRPDLKNINRSQLKNKVVCENHFSENMFMNYKHERLIHSAVPNKEHTDDDLVDQFLNTKNFDATPISNSNIDLNNEVTSTMMGTDVMSIDKELSTMTVNVSSVTGISFISPPEKKPNSAPYIEILTRLHNNSIQCKKRPSFQPFHSTPMKAVVKSNKEIKTNPLSKFGKLQKYSDDSTEIKKDILYAPNLPLNKDKRSQQTTICSTTNLLEHENNIVHQETNYKAPSTNVVHNKISHDVVVPHSTHIQKCRIQQPESVNTPILSKNTPKLSSDSANVTNSAKEIQTLLKAVVDRNLTTNKTKNTDIETLPSVSENINSGDNNNQCMEQENYMEFIKEGKKVLNELKMFLEKEKSVKGSEKIRKVKNTTKPLSKSNLYARIVPFLTPETARIVHKELFPSMRHMHILS